MKIKIFVSACLLFLLLGGTKSVLAATVNYDQLLPIAKKYIGVPYKTAGNDEFGFDCSGFIHKVFSEMNMNISRTTAQQSKEGVAVDKKDLRIGDLVFFNTNGKGVSHSGIYIGNNEFIHASSSKGVMISNLDDPYYWKTKYIGARRVLDYSLAIGEFHDVNQQHWAYQNVNKLATNDITIGYSMSYFKPEDRISRADVATMIAEAFHLKANDRSSTFPDVPSTHWAIGVVNAVYKEGIFKGNDNSEFRPNDSLTRGQMAAILTRTFKLESSSTKKNFTDVPATHWAYDDIERLAASGITTGYEEDHTFKPNNYVTRSQFAAFLSRAMYH